MAVESFVPLAFALHTEASDDGLGNRAEPTPDARRSVCLRTVDRPVVTV